MSLPLTGLSARRAAQTTYTDFDDAVGQYAAFYFRLSSDMTLQVLHHTAPVVWQIGNPRV